MPVNPLGYPLDLQGNNPANFIVNEIRTFNTAAQRLFVPSAGPFYRMDFEIRNNVTNQLLLPNTDYKIVHLHKAAVLISGKNVNAGIYVHNTNIPSVRVSYRVIGGHFADTADVIRQLFLDNPPTDAATIPWDHVFGAPAQMPPVEHLHDMLDTYGYGNLITVLEQLRVAVIAGDGPAIDAIYRYIEILLTNSGFVTAQEVLNMVNFDTANQVKVYATYADLRAETELPNNSDLLYITLGKNTRYDGRGRQFVWSIASTDVDDNDKVVKPTIILTNGNGPGRLLSVLNVERDLKNSLETLGRKINNDGVVLTDLAATFPLTVDLDTVVTAGTYWVAPTAINKPAGTTKAHLFVEVSETFVTQTLISIVQNDRNMVGENDLVTAVTTARVFTRNAQFSGGNYLWEDWRGLIDRDTLNIALQSLGRNIGTDYKLETGIVNLGLTYSGNLNDIAASGTVWFTNTQTNRPFDYGILETIVLDADTLHQRAYWNYREAVRLKSTSGWGDWRFVQSKDLAVDRNLHNTAANLNTILTPDTYYYGLDCTNKPTEYGILLVRRESDNVVYQEAHGADNTKHIRYRDNSGTWTRWLKAMDSIEMERHGINTAISAHYTLSPTTDVDTVTTPGKYYIGNTQINRPSDFGILEVELISGTIDAPGEIEQTFKCSLLKVFTTRRRYWNGTAHVWGNWEYRAMRNGQIDQIFNMETLPSNLIDPSHGINSWYLATQFAAPLWARLTANGIDAAIAATNVLPANTNLNAVHGVGKYWYSLNYDNSPFDYAILEVEMIDATNLIQTAYDGYRRATRRTNNLIDWSPWLFSSNLNIATESSYANANLNDAIFPGEYYYNNNSINAPSYYGLVKVWRETGSIIYQQAQSSANQFFTRYRASNGDWTAWTEYVNQSELALLAAQVAPLTTYESVAVNPGSGGATSYVTHYIAAGARRLTIAIIAPGGGGGAGGWAEGGSGGGGGAGGFGQLIIQGKLDGFYVVIQQPPDNGSAPLNGQGWDTWGSAPYNNPSSYAIVYDAGGTAVFQMEVRSGQTGGTADSQWHGDGYSNGGGPGARGTATMWRNAGYSKVILTHSFATDASGNEATRGAGNANPGNGQGGTVNTSARDGWGGNPHNDGHGGVGGAFGSNLGSLGGTGAARIQWD